MYTTCYLVNRPPSSALGDNTPHDVWNSKKHYLKHLIVFGSDGYVHLLKEIRSKLDMKYEKCIFIRHKYDLKDYMIWNLKSKEVLYNRDVIFTKVKSAIK